MPTLIKNVPSFIKAFDFIADQLYAAKSIAAHYNLLCILLSTYPNHPKASNILTIFIDHLETQITTLTRYLQNFKPHSITIPNSILIAKSSASLTKMPILKPISSWHSIYSCNCLLIQKVQKHSPNFSSVYKIPKNAPRQFKKRWKLSP